MPKACHGCGDFGAEVISGLSRKTVIRRLKFQNFIHPPTDKWSRISRRFMNARSLSQQRITASIQTALHSSILQFPKLPLGLSLLKPPPGEDYA
jgi:hypothetical protein